MFLENITLAQLRAATKAQIVTFITNKLTSMTKLQIVIWLMDNVLEIADAQPEVIYKDGQITRLTECIRDTYTGDVLRYKRVIWTYYDLPGNPVDKITIIIADPNMTVISKRVIKHFVDGRQPVMESVP